MLNEYTRTYKAEGKGVNRLDVSITYALGGINYFTYKNEPRGYYFSIQPWESDGVWRKFTAFSGVKMCALPCNRQSKKRYEEAKGMIDDLAAEYLAEFCEKNGIELLGNEYTENERERKVH